jgi:hypothetical protein
MNYEEVAALDDEPPADGPTVEAHALPGDELLWKALASNGSLELPSALVLSSEPVLPNATATGTPIRDGMRAREGAEDRTVRTVRPARPRMAVLRRGSSAAPGRTSWRLQLLSVAFVAMLVGGALTWLAHKALVAWGSSSSFEPHTE